MNKNRYIIILVTIIVFSWIYTALKTNNLNDKLKYHNNRKIEYEYLVKIVNESKLNLLYFENKFEKEFKKYDELGTYILNENTIVNSEYFTKRNYNMDSSDFFGYAFSFDEKDLLVGFSFHKP